MTTYDMCVEYARLVYLSTYLLRKEINTIKIQILHTLLTHLYVEMKSNLLQMKKNIIEHERSNFIANVSKFLYLTDAPIRLIIRTAIYIIQNTPGAQYDKTLKDAYKLITNLAIRINDSIISVNLRDIIPNRESVKTILLKETMVDVVNAIPEMLQFIDEITVVYKYGDGVASAVKVKFPSGTINDLYFLYCCACISFKYSFYYNFGTLEHCESILKKNAIEFQNIKNIILYIHIPPHNKLYITSTIDGKFPRPIDREIDSLTREIIELESKIIRGSNNKALLIEKKHTLEKLYNKVNTNENFAHDVDKDKFDKIEHSASQGLSFTKTLSISENGTDVVFSFIIQHTNDICTLLSFDSGFLWKNKIEDSIKELIMNEGSTQTKCLFNTDSLLESVKNVL